MKAISLCYNYSIFDFLLKFWNVRQEWGKIQKLEYFKSQENVSVEIKSIFRIFEGFYAGEIKKLAGTSLEWSYEIF